MICSTCDKPARFVASQAQWWCDACEVYRPGPPPPPPASASTPIPSAVWIAVVCSAVLIVAPFLPWVTSPFMSVSGVDGGGDGWILLALSLVPMLMAIRGAQRRAFSHGDGVGITICALLAGGLVAIDLAHAAERLADVAIARIGIGMYAGLAAALLLLVVGAWVAAKGPDA